MGKLTFIIVLLSLSILSCTTQNKRENENNLDLRGYTKRGVKLINNMGTLSIYLPTEIDSFFTFIQHEDYPGGDIQILRFSGKKYTVDNDGGYFHTLKIDSIYQFTIEQAVCMGGVFGKIRKLIQLH